MTPTEQKQLSKGRVPRRLIRERVLAFIEAEGPAAGHGGNDGLPDEDRELDSPVSGLAAALDMTYDQLHDAILRKSGPETMNFDLADRMLCKIGRWDDWLLDPELNEVYVQVDLSQHPCERVGCTKIIPEEIRFCSEFCAENPEDTSQRISTFMVAA